MQSNKVQALTNLVGAWGLREAMPCLTPVANAHLQTTDAIELMHHNLPFFASEFTLDAARTHAWHKEGPECWGARGTPMGGRGETRLALINLVGLPPTCGAHQQGAQV